MEIFKYLTVDNFIYVYKIYSYTKIKFIVWTCLEKISIPYTQYLMSIDYCLFDQNKHSISLHISTWIRVSMSVLLEFSFPSIVQYCKTTIV